LVILEIGSCIYVCIYGMDCSPPICTFRVAEITGSGHRAQPLVEMRSHELFAWTGLKLWFYQCPPPKLAGLQA
jgi:hypothetical protein